MFELTYKWHSNDKSIFSKRLYKTWTCVKLYPIMLTKISTSWYHQLAVGRGKLNSNSRCVHDTDVLSPSCRFGCHADETVEHIFLRCPFLLPQQTTLRTTCSLSDIPYTIQHLLTDDNLKIDVERLLLKLINHGTT